MGMLVLNMKDGRQVNLRMNDDGKACIHWFRYTPDGPIDTIPHQQLKHPQIDGVRGTRGVIACNPTQNTVAPRIVGKVHYICQRSDDLRSVTCEKCRATPEAQEILAKETLDAMQKMGDNVK